MGGIPDVTEKLKSKYYAYKYTETIYVEDPEITVSRFKDNLLNCADSIKSLGAIPVFCTITRCNINDYNNSLLQKGSTSILYHQDHYSDMQEVLNQVIDKINSIIKETNQSNHLSTPHCHSAITKRRGTKGGYRIYAWELLRDGVHGTEKTLQAWADSLSAAIKCNRR